MNISHVYEEYLNGTGVYALAEKYAIHPQTIYRKFKRNGFLLLDKRSRPVKYSNQEVKIWHDEHLSGKSINRIALNRKIDPSTIYSRFKRLDLPYKKYKNQSRLAPVIDLIYKRYIEGEPISELSFEFNCSGESINRLIRQKGLKRVSKAYEVNSDFFKEINSEISAYLLGFFVADGCIYNESRMGLLIQANDKYILDLYQRFVCPGQKIHFLPKKSKKDQVLLRWSSKIMVSHLRRLKLDIRKTYSEIFTFDLIPSVYKRHFVRGIIDGDGHTTKGIIITNTSKKLLEGIQNWFLEFGISFKLKKQANCYRLECWNKAERSLISKIMIHNSHAYLRRKWNH